MAPVGAGRGVADRVVVTGGQGFIGRFLVAECVARKARTFALGRSPFLARRFTHSLRCGGRELAAPVPFDMGLLPQDAYFQTDLNDADRTAAVMERTSPDLVVHLAGALSVSSTQRLTAGNVEATRALLHAIDRSSASPRRIVLGSTCSVYGSEALELPIREDRPPAPTTEYARTKLEAERMASNFCADRGIDLIVARIFNVMGPGQDDRHFPGRLAAQVTSIVNGWTPPRMEFGDLTPTRDFIDVRDTARALVNLTFGPDSAGVINVGTGVETRVGELLELALQASGLAKRVEVARDAQHRPAIPRHCASFDRLADRGFGLEHAVDGSLHDLLAYYRSCFPAEP